MINNCNLVSAIAVGVLLSATCSVALANNANNPTFDTVSALATANMITAVSSPKINANEFNKVSAKASATSQNEFSKVHAKASVTSQNEFSKASAKASATSKSTADFDANKFNQAVVKATANINDKILDPATAKQDAKAFLQTNDSQESAADTTISANKAVNSTSNLSGPIDVTKITNADMQNIISSTQGLTPDVLQLGLKAYAYAEKQGKVQQPILTVVDFNMPSTQKRMWVIDLKNDKVLFNTLVAQGKNSGTLNATKFSNKDGTDESSLGVYTTEQTFAGEHGHDLRLDGLEQGINNNAYNRDIVVHSAWYVSDSFVKQNGYLGRSWGCFALDKSIAPQVINTIKDGSVIFAYAPQEATDPNLTKI